MILFASNLNKQTTLQEINDLFATFGQVVKSKLMLNDLTKRSRGCAYIDMPDNGMAQNAIEALNNTTFMGEKIEVKESGNRDATAIAWR